MAKPLFNIIMMCKNEDELLPIWAKYHGSLFGYTNLTVIDNGSSSINALRALDHIERCGARVLRNFSEPEHFRDKGDVILDLIRQYETENPANFYIPMDCDEFIGVKTSAGLSYYYRDILTALSPFFGDERGLRIAAAFDNNPILPGYFREVQGQRKSFFADGMARILDHGFHEGLTASDRDPVRTPLVFMHYHYKPYELLIEHTWQKLTPYVGPIARSEVHLIPDNVPGSHLLSHLRTKNSEEYYTSFREHPGVSIPAFAEALLGCGARLPFSSGHGPLGFDAQAYLAANPDVTKDAETHYLVFGRFEGRKLS
jgi:hypothetical protein